MSIGELPELQVVETIDPLLIRPLAS